MKNSHVNILILIVEDDKYMNETFREVLETEGYDVDSSVNAIDAINKIKHGNRRYNLLLLDYNLNDRYGINGLDIFEAAKQVNPRIKGVMVSAYGEHMIKELSRQKGIKTFIDKPFLITDLVDSIDKALNNNMINNNI